MEKGLKDVHLPSLLLSMSIRGTEEEENLPTGAPRVGFVYFQCFTASNRLV